MIHPVPWVPSLSRTASRCLRAASWPPTAGSPAAAAAQAAGSRAAPSRRPGRTGPDPGSQGSGGFHPYTMGCIHTYIYIYTLYIYIYTVYIYIWARSPDPHTPPSPPNGIPPPLLTLPTPPKPSICMFFAHIHTHIHIYTPLSTPPTSHLYVICSTWEPRPRQRTVSTCIFLS